MTNDKPWRAIVRGAFLVGWTEAAQDEKDRVFKEYLDIHQLWVSDLDVKFIASLDDELMMVGSPGGRMWNFYEVYEIPAPATVKKMLDYLRYPADGHLRLDKYFRLEVVVGHPIGSLERILSGD
jgi:hypothetical protein